MREEGRRGERKRKGEKKGGKMKEMRGGQKEGSNGALRSHLFQVSICHAEEVRELDTVTLEEREKISQL